MMSKKVIRLLAVVLALTMAAAACGDSDDSSDDGDGDTSDAEIDYEAIGLWDDGECDESLETLKVGLMTVFESPVISLEDQALALEASADAFNERGGANGACIEVFTCDDGATADQAIGCAREITEAGVVATVNDQGTAAQGEVSEAMAAAGIPRIASNVTNNDWGDPNAYPLDASGTGVTFLMPQALVDAGVSDIATIRVDLPEASALLGILEDIYAGKATFKADIPVPAGTTDFSQFILAAEQADAGGATMALGEQEAIQIVRAAQQLGSDLVLGSSIGSFSHSNIRDLGDFSEQMAFIWSFAPPTADIAVYDAMRADLEASGEESLQTENLKASPVRSWIGLYALLYMIREADMTEFTGEGITGLLQSATDIPMLEIYGDETWTPNESHPGIFSRAGIDRWVTYSWDPEADGPVDGGNFTEVSEVSFDEVLCGSPFGAPGPC